MARTSQQRKAKAARERYADNRGLCFDELRLVLPDRVSDWETPRVVIKSEACSIMHDLFGFCFLCSKSERSYSGLKPLEAHHICAGARRSDELCNIVILCHEHHDAVQSQPGELKRVLKAKWRHDREHTDWRRLLLLYGRWWDVDSLD